MMRPRSSGLLLWIPPLAIAAWLSATGPGPARGQELANPIINNFEIAPAGSLEADILERLATMNRYDPRDLFRLARLTVLESIAMYENLRADLPAIASGARREGEMSAVLWDAAELFYAGVTPSDLPSLIRARPLPADVEAAYAQLEATLGELQGGSPRAALHLRNVARMLPVMNALIDAMEAELVVPAEPIPPALDVASMRQQTRRLVDELRNAALALGEAKPATAGRDALVADLHDLTDLVQGFDRALAAGATGGELIASLRLLRGRLWPIEARFLRAARTPELAGRWRPIRQQLNALSDRFDRPRVIAPGAATRPAASVDRALLAQADRAVAAMDDFLSANPSTASLGASQYQDDLAQLRRRLLLFRQRVAAGEPVDSLNRSLREIEDLNRRLGQRTRAEARIFRGGPRPDARAFQAPAQAVEKLRERMPNSPDNARTKAP
jgi:hypothetical protein